LKFCVKPAVAFAVEPGLLEEEIGAAAAEGIGDVVVMSGFP
jgi:hypothetical protein